MKIFFFILVFSFVCSSCEKDQDAMLTQLEVMTEQIAPSYTSAVLQCSFTTKATLHNVYVQYAKTQDFAEYEEREMLKADDIYMVMLDSLQDNTTYYVRYAVSNRYSSVMVKDIRTFQTLQPSVPTIKIAYIDIWDTYAKTQIVLDFDGGAPVTEMGIYWDIQTTPAVENKVTIKDTSAILEIRSLQPNTKYYLRAYAKNKVGVAYSEEISFITLTLPQVQTGEITDINLTTALLNGILVSDGNDTATIKGFCWSENPQPTINNQKQVTTNNAFTYLLSNLEDKTKYYVRAYAQNKIGIVYGAEKSFTTQSAAIPVVTTSSMTNITYASATAGGNITSDGGATITERGVVYAITQNPTTSHTKVKSGAGTGSFTCNLTGLQANTTYYVRAYAINRKGTAYGKQVSFTTSNGMENGYEYVNMGLSVKWATCNVGANSSEDYGDYFAWGETSTKKAFEWSTYKWCNGSYTSLIKYNNNSVFGTVDNKTQLDLSDDAAQSNWGGAWRMPTHTELRELLDNCMWTWTTQNGVNGYKVTSKSNGSSIFLPAAGKCLGSSLCDIGYYGYYLSSSLSEGYPGYPNYSNYLYFFSGAVNFGSHHRCDGYPVRPVCQ